MRLPFKARTWNQIDQSNDRCLKTALLRPDAMYTIYCCGLSESALREILTDCRSKENDVLTARISMYSCTAKEHRPRHGMASKTHNIFLSCTRQERSDFSKSHPIKRLCPTHQTAGDLMALLHKSVIPKTEMILLSICLK